MAGNLSSPRVCKNQQNTQLSYELPHRIHTAKCYPIQSPNGSTVIIYGHEYGVKIVWRGGRPFKTPEEVSATPKKPNGNENAVILLDSDDEGPAIQAYEDKPEFEDEEAEFDPSRPYPGVLQVLDLYFGSDVLHLALLPPPILRADAVSWRGAESLKQKIVFTASCADNTVRLVTLPLTPPSPTSKARSDFRSNFTQSNAGNGKWGETVVLLGGHKKPCDGLAMTVDFTSNSGQDQLTAEPKSSTPTEPQIIIASHSRELTGLLLLYRASISSPKPHIEPFQTVYLGSPASTISFNPAVSRPLASQLLVADATGACRIYDYKLLVKTSTAEELSSDSLIAEHGTWLLSLYPGFQSNNNDPSIGQQIAGYAAFGRKNIVDAKWVSGGRAILVLLNDGEWAIWDIEGVRPGASHGLLGHQGIKGGSRTEFSLTGFIEGAAKPRISGPPQNTTSKFAPMTPGTRKSADPFTGRGASGPVRGQISVVEVPSHSPTNPSEECILFWLGESFTVIPSLSKYWAANARKSTAGSGNLFNGTPGSRMIKLESIDLQGERCSGIDQLVKIQSPASLPSDILILGEHRFTILSAGKQTSHFRPEGRMVLEERSTNTGELDVVGIDQALARMENANGFFGKRKALQP